MQASSSGGGGGGGPSHLPRPLVSRRRVIMHVDMDCFYAQVDRERFPHWRGRPIAVVQNGSLAVTTNYRVRERGLPKTGPAEPTAIACPQTMFAGSNMVRYRAASKAWYGLFQTFPRLVIMKKGIDECYLDLTAEATHRIREGQVRRLVRMSSEERARLDELASRRFALAERAWRAVDASMLARGVAPVDLESTGALRAAVLLSKSTDPITALRKKQAGSDAPKAGFVGLEPDREPAPHRPPPPLNTNPKAKAIEGWSEAEIAAHCERVHPIDHCRADRRLPPCMLVNQDDAKGLDPLPGTDTAPWRETFVGWIMLDGTDAKPKPGPVVKPDDGATSSVVDPADAATSLEDLAAYPDDIPPALSFANEDPLNPSHDYLLAVGSQIAFDIRCALFTTLGYTTSAGVASNCMVAKLASSANKPNQQSVVRPSIAPTFMRDLKLRAISGFGPKATEHAAAQGLETVGDVQRMARTPGALARCFSDKFAAYLLDIAQAIDDTPVIVHEAPKSLGQSKQQKTRTHAERVSLLAWLCEKLFDRLIEDEREYARRPTIFLLSWYESGWNGASRRCAMPNVRENRSDSLPLWHDMYEAGLRLCKQNIPPNALISCLSVGATQFAPFQQGKGSIAGYFTGAGQAPTSSTPRTTTTTQVDNDDGVTILDDFAATPAHTNASSAAAPPNTSSLDAFFSSSHAPDASSSAAAVTTSADSSLDMPPLEVPTIVQSSIEEGAIRERQLRQFDAVEDSVDDVPFTAEDESGLGRFPEEDIDELFALADSEPTTTVAAAAATTSDQLTVCPECAQSVPTASFAEHSDFHFAATVQQQLRQADRLQREKEQQQAASSASSQSQHSVKRKKSGSSSAASPAAKNMSLDRFMVAQPAASPSPRQIARPHAVPAKPRATVGPKRSLTASTSAAAAASNSLSLTAFFKAK